MGAAKQFLLVLIAGLYNYQVSGFEIFQQRVDANSSELCIITISPKTFGWGLGPDTVNQIEYNARISQAPDLPHWMYYTYDRSTSTGLLYGVPPPRLASMDFDVIAWNRHQSYEVRKLIISLEITPKPKYEYILELKIDNMNVNDLSVPRRMTRLLNMFSNYLDWTHEDGGQVTPVYMASAGQHGEIQVSNRPSDPEGVILHLGSNKNFSAELYKLHSEVEKLWKLRPCPRDLKRTSLEKYFRGQGFLSDWCSFRLTITSEDPSLNSEETLSQNPDGIESEDGDESENSQKIKDADIFHFRTSIPERGYGVGILLATIVPGTIGGLVGFLLLALLWSDRDETAPACRKETRNGNNGADLSQSQKRGDYQHYRPPSEDEDFVMLTGDDERFVPSSEDREISTTPLPPQYGATHPNGSPALTYAV